MLRSAHSPIRQIVFDFCLRRVGYPLFPLRSPKGAHCEEDVSTKSRCASMLEPLLGIGGTASLSCFAPQNKKRAPREQSTHVSPPSEPAFGFKLRQASGLRFSGGIPKHLCYPSGLAERASCVRPRLAAHSPACSVEGAHELAPRPCMVSRIVHGFRGGPSAACVTSPLSVGHHEGMHAFEMGCEKPVSRRAHQI